MYGVYQFSMLFIKFLLTQILEKLVVKQVVVNKVFI